MGLAFCPDFLAYSFLCRLVVLHPARFKLAAYHHRPRMCDGCLSTDPRGDVKFQDSPLHILEYCIDQ